MTDDTAPPLELQGDVIREHASLLELRERAASFEPQWRRLEFMEATNRMLAELEAMMARWEKDARG